MYAILCWLKWPKLFGSHRKVWGKIGGIVNNVITSTSICTLNSLAVKWQCSLLLSYAEFSWI